jgi:hypothetical protein
MQPTDEAMNCTLEICGQKKIQNPTEADIRQAVFALNTKDNDSFLILAVTDMTYIQTTGDQKLVLIWSIKTLTLSIITGPSASLLPMRS